MQRKQCGRQAGALVPGLPPKIRGHAVAKTLMRRSCSKAANQLQSLARRPNKNTTALILSLYTVLFYLFRERVVQPLSSWRVRTEICEALLLTHILQLRHCLEARTPVFFYLNLPVPFFRSLQSRP